MKEIKNSNAFGIIGAFSLVILLAASAVFAQSKASVRVSGEASVESDRVTLGDIAEISGAESAVEERLKNISLGYAPNVGMSREIFRDKIALSIAAAGFSKNEFSLVSPPKILVSRVAQTIEKNALRQAIETAVLAEFENKNVTAKIARLDLPPEFQIPTGRLEIRAGSINAVNFFAPFSVSLEIRVDDKTFRRLTTTVEVEASAEIFVAAGELKTGEKLSEANVRRETRRLVKPLNFYLRDARNLRGTVLVKNLSANDAITTDALAAGYVVRAGDAVRIFGESGKMRIIINGEARSSGRIGDRIAVKNSQSNAVLQAVVLDEGTVKILF